MAFRIGRILSATPYSHRYVGRNRTAFSDWSAWAYVQHLHLLYYHVYDADMSEPSPATYRPWFSEYFSLFRRGDITQWLDARRLAPLILSGLELAATRRLDVHNGEAQYTRAWEPSAKTCWELIHKYPMLHKWMIGSNWKESCKVHQGHSCYALLEWSDEKLQSCWGVDLPERRQLIADNTAPLVQF